MTTLMQRVERATVRVIMLEPFVGAVMSCLRHVHVPSLPHLAATDGGAIYWSDRAAELDDTSLRGLLVHEVMHVMLSHHIRLPKEIREVGERLRQGRAVSAEERKEWRRRRTAWGLATDVKINHAILTSNATVHGLVRLPWGGITPQTLGLDDRTVEAMTEESLYRWLLENRPDLCDEPSEGQGTSGEGSIRGQWGENVPKELEADGGACDVVHGGKGSLSEKQVASAIMRAAVLRRAGTERGFLGENLVERVRGGRVDWRRLLAEALTSRLGGETTWRRRSRRSSETILPGRREEVIGQVTVVMDTSGSCWNYISEWLAQLRSLLATIPVDELRVIAHGVDAREIFRGRPDELPEDLRVPRGGGTAFHPAVRMVNEEPCEAVVWLTDLCSSDGLPGDSLPRLQAQTVVWVVPEEVHREEVPQGRIGVLREETRHAA